MELTVIGSSSKGNSYVIQNESEAIVIECGMPFIEVKKVVNFNIKKIVCALCTHEHLDHSKHVNEFLNARIPVLMSNGTKNKLHLNGGIIPTVIENGIKLQYGNFTILSFDVKHDAEQPIGFIIKHEEMGVTLFVTDSYFVPYTFANLNNIIIEANYRMDLLQSNISAGRIPAALRERTLQSHMSLETCLEALQANDLRKVNNIVLCHLSDGNSSADEFKQAAHKATGKTVHIADKGMTLKFNKTPF